MNVFLDPKNPLLNKRAKEVLIHEIPLLKTQVHIDQMFEAVMNERTDASKRKLVGLAGPQIGIDKRIILVDMAVNSERNVFGELQAFINPEILWYSEELLWDKEHCFSVDQHIEGVVARAESIKLIAYDRLGNPIMHEINGFTARIFQHEIDHLNGICFSDRIGKDGILHCSWDNWKREGRDCCKDNSL